MNRVAEAVDRVAGSLPTWKVVLYTLMLGLLGGGGSQMALDKFFVHANLGQTLTRLNASIDSLSTTLSAHDALITRTRCEVRAERDGLDWRDCWTPMDLSPGR